MSSTANFKPTPGAALPAVLLANTVAEQIVLSAVATPVPTAGNPGVPTFLPLVVSIPSGSVLEQQEWSGSASGFTTIGAAMNLTAKLYSGTSATPGSNTLLATSGAVAIAGASSFPFIISIEKAIYDSVSGKLNGVVEMLVGGTLVARGLFGSVITGINNNNNPVLNLCLSFTFSVANAANKVNVQTFEIDF